MASTLRPTGPCGIRGKGERVLWLFWITSAKAVGSVKLSSPTNRTESRHQEVDFLVHQPSDVTQDRERYWSRGSEGWTQ
ncbi:hypothetical protein OYC64_018957 [Pagothenia borchgrevinki]|uniref:Uncharacterized protein n=1 Tax=Pagothenia borchgrevinki TaxID=8213 RepID=A0ABD2GR88_PAGBO